MPYLKFLAPGIQLLKTPEVSAFIPISSDGKRQLIYNAGKIAGKLSEKKHAIQILYEISGGDLVNVYKNLENCKTDAERSKALLELITQSTLATVTGTDLTTNEEVAELFVAGLSASGQLAQYQARAALFEASKNFTKEYVLPTDIQQIIEEVVKKGKRPESFSLILRLRGPKPGETSFQMPNKPPSQEAFDRWWKSDIFGARNNSTNVNNINRGGAQIDQILSLNGGHQPTIGIEIEKNFNKKFRLCYTII